MGLGFFFGHGILTRGRKPSVTPWSAQCKTYVKNGPKLNGLGGWGSTDALGPVRLRRPTFAGSACRCGSAAGGRPPRRARSALQPGPAGGPRSAACAVRLCPAAAPRVLLVID